MNETNTTVPILASANLSLGGLSVLVAKIVPHLSTIAVLVQILVGVVSLWHMLKPKKGSNEKDSTDVNPKS